jgi:hypothetical protein
VSFGTERVEETATIEPFFAPGNVLEFFVDGKTPTVIEFLAKGSIIASSPPFGPTVISAVPLIESVPGALDGSTESFEVQVGAAYKKKGKTTYFLTVPKKCPKGGFPLKAVMEFGNINNPKEPGESAEAAYKTPCPKK